MPYLLPIPKILGNTHLKYGHDSPAQIRPASSLFIDIIRILILFSRTIIGTTEEVHFWNRLLDMRLPSRLLVKGESEWRRLPTTRVPDVASGS